MSPEQINRAIHRERGLPVMTDGWVPSYRDPDNREGAPEAEPIDLPDYLNDLNAMHEAEKILTNCQLYDYEAQLWEAVRREDENWIPYELGTRATRATAAERAEAFLRTLKLWTTEASS